MSFAENLKKLPGISHLAAIAVLDADGNVLNRKAAPKWRNAASRSDDDIYNELMGEEN